MTEEQRSDAQQIGAKATEVIGLEPLSAGGSKLPFLALTAKGRGREEQEMPSYERALDLVQGYNFKKDVQNPFGFITSMMIGTTQVPNDQVVTTPVSELGKSTSDTAATGDTAGLSVCGVLKNIKWDLGDTDPIEFQATLSVTGKQMIMGMLYATMISINVAINFVVYEYDPLSTKYFVAFSNTVAGGTSDVAFKSTASISSGAQGMIKKDGGNLAMTISPTAATDVQSPENYDFSLGLS